MPRRRKRELDCEEEDVALVPPTITVHESGRGLRAPIGFVHFPDPPAEPAKPRRRKTAKRKAARPARKW